MTTGSRGPQRESKLKHKSLEEFKNLSENDLSLAFLK